MPIRAAQIQGIQPEVHDTADTLLQLAIEETRQFRHSLARFGQVGILPEEVPHALEDVEIRLDLRMAQLRCSSTVWLRHMSRVPESKKAGG